MRKDWEKLFSRLEPPEPPEGLFGRVMSRIGEEQRISAARRRFVVFSFILLAVGVGFLFGGKKDAQNPASDKIPYVSIAGTEIPVEVARTDKERAKGLSGRISLEADRGMLFVFPEPGAYSFWMPDMNFPIDIIWIADGKVVGIEKDVSNEFDPQNPVFYFPPKPVKYVLEVNAGFSEANGIKIGDGVIFRNIE